MSVVYSSKLNLNQSTGRSINNNNNSSNNNNNGGITGEECPPVDFQISSSESSDADNFAFDVGGDSYSIGEKCPLCFRLKKNYTCKECLLKGDFNHSSTSSLAGRKTYSELKLKFLLSKQKRNELIEKCEVFTRKKEQIAEIVEEIERYVETIGIQKELRNELKQRISSAEHEAESMKKLTMEKEQRWPLYRARLDNMNQQYRHKLGKLQKFYGHVHGRKGLLKSVSKTGILQLKEYVFPIHEINGRNHRDFSLDMDYKIQDKMTNASCDLWEEEEDDTVSALMAASNYWGRPDELVSSFGTCYSITGESGPTLPESGDYSAYNMWSGRNEGITTPQSTTRNPAHCIAASLTYATQFVNLIAYYLDLRLPHRLSYSEFTNGNLVGGKFNRKVAKLNANVIHLCASQGIAPTFLQPRRTIPNLLLLFDPEMADLGSRGPFEVATQLAKSMEESIEKDLVIYEEDSSESDNDWTDSNFPSDWENVQRGTISDEVSAENMTNHNQSYFLSTSPSSQYQSDIFTRSRQNSNPGGFVSSVTSFFKGWGK